MVFVGALNGETFLVSVLFAPASENGQRSKTKQKGHPLGTGGP
jgi:hypothetical protein